MHKISIGVDMEGVTREHTLRLENSALYISGVQGVLFFEQNEAMLQLDEGTLRILGEGLELIDLSIKNGNIVIKGKVVELAYGKAREKGNFIKRLFK